MKPTLVPISSLASLEAERVKVEGEVSFFFQIDSLFTRTIYSLLIDAVHVLFYVLIIVLSPSPPNKKS